MTPNPSLDLVTIGRCSVDLYGEQVGGHLEDMQSFAKYVGGCPANVAIGAARLGLRAALLSRVGDDHMGRFIIDELKRNGVVTSAIQLDSDRLTALVILGIRNREQFPLVFYREDCADMALSADELDESLIQSSKAVLITGTHLSTQTTYDASLRAVKYAKQAGRKVILDIDYRPVLWGLTPLDHGEERFVENSDVTMSLQTVLPHCDLVVGTEEEIHIIGGETDTLIALQRIRVMTEATIVLKRGGDGCVVFDNRIPRHLEDGIAARGFPVEVYNVLGAGDGFLSGFLRGWLREDSLGVCSELGNACGAIVVSRHGCAPATPTWEELDRFIDDQRSSRPNISSRSLDQLHWSTTRGPQLRDLCVLAMDHRVQFEALANSVGATSDKIAQFKSLSVDTLARMPNGDLELGLLMDSRYGEIALDRVMETNAWVGRPVEVSGVMPLQFETETDVVSEIRQWPRRHVVKCLCHYHPTQDSATRRRQDESLRLLFSACRQSGHELLLEIIASSAGIVEDHTVSEIMAHIYDLGVYPDWWKLEAQRDGGAWSHVQRTIHANDRHCRGVLVLGLAAPIEELTRSLSAAAAFPIIRGFAVGRTVFESTAQQWFADNIDDRAAIEQMGKQFRILVAAWKDARTQLPNKA